METKQIKENIKIHTIETSKFKTNIVSIFLTTPLNRKTVTSNAVLTAVLRRGNNALKTQQEISEHLEEMYGASFDCGIDKMGDNQVLKFYIESINDIYLPKQENILLKTVELLLDIVFNPLIENNAFKKEYVDMEKENIKQIIENKIEDKAEYATNRCIEEMYKNEPYGLYKYGYIEDLENITPEALYQHYLKLIKNCKIDIFVSGSVNEKATEIIENNRNIQELEGRKVQTIFTNNESNNETKTIEESMNVTQGKLILGLDLKNNSKYATTVYNAILRRNSSVKIVSKCKRKSTFSICCTIKICKTKKYYFNKMWN